MSKALCAAFVLTFVGCGPISFPSPPSGPLGSGPGSGTSTAASSGPSGPSSAPAQDCSFKCGGCCTEDGVCHAGTSVDFCGWGGQLCNSCPSGQTCDPAANGGTCSTCNAQNCSGCCDAYGQCVAGTADEACGNFGQRCVSCTGNALCRPTGTGGGICD